MRGTALARRRSAETISGGGGGWSPLSLPNLTGWWDASNAGSITSSSGLVSQWNDLSTNAKHFVQATGANKPLTGADTVNGLNAIRFSDGDQRHMTATFSGASSNALTIYIVWKPGAGYNFAEFVPRVWHGGNHVASMGWGANATIQIRNDYVGNVAMTTNAMPSSTPVQVTLTAGASLFKGYVNGTLNTTSGASATVNQTIDDVFLGQLTFGSPEITFQVCELVMSSVVDNTTDQQACEAYLKSKWGTP